MKKKTAKIVKFSQSKIGARKKAPTSEPSKNRVHLGRAIDRKKILKEYL